MLSSLLLLISPFLCFSWQCRQKAFSTDCPMSGLTTSTSSLHWYELFLVHGKSVPDTSLPNSLFHSIKGEILAYILVDVLQVHASCGRAPNCQADHLSICLFWFNHSGRGVCIPSILLLLLPTFSLHQVDARKHFCFLIENLINPEYYSPYGVYPWWLLWKV